MARRYANSVSATSSPCDSEKIACSRTLLSSLVLSITVCSVRMARGSPDWPSQNTAEWRVEGEKLREAVLFGMSEDRAAGGQWLLERARDTRESMRLRKSALFWAGQREATPTADLAGVYRAVNDAALREHAIFVLSQREDEEALNVLIGIAKSDSDTRMRGKALFWLAQKDDPRVKKLIGDLVLR